MRIPALFRIIGSALFSTALLVAASARASEVRNGGNAVVCYRDASKREVVSVELFDYWEMDRIYRYPGGVRVSDPSADTVTILKELLGRFARFEPEKSKAFLEEATRIAKNIDYYLENDIGTVNDDTSRQIPNSPCFKEQYAVQTANPTDQKRFRVSRRLYDDPHNDNLSRAGIILHEVIYRDAVKTYGHRNSDGTRLLNYFVATEALPAFDCGQYQRVVEDAGFPRPVTEFLVPSIDTTVFVHAPAKRRTSVWPKKGAEPEPLILACPAKIATNATGLSGVLSTGSSIELGRASDSGSIRSAGPGMIFTTAMGDAISASRFDYSLTGGDTGVLLFDEVTIRTAAQPAICHASAQFDRERRLRYCHLPRGKTQTFLFPDGRRLPLESPPADFGPAWDVKFDERGIPTWIWGFSIDPKLSVGVPFRVAGTNWVLPLTQAYLNAAGEATTGTSLEGVNLKVGNETIPVDKGFSFLPGAAGGLEIRGAIYWVTPPRVNGLRMIATEAAGYPRAHAENYCRGAGARIGADAFNLSNFHELENVDVIGREEFYDPGTKKTVAIVDDRVLAYKEVGCVYKVISYKP